MTYYILLTIYFLSLGLVSVLLNANKKFKIKNVVFKFFVSALAFFGLTLVMVVIVAGMYLMKVMPIITAFSDLINYSTRSYPVYY